MGWDDDGRPTSAKLAELSLGWTEDIQWSNMQVTVELFSYFRQGRFKRDSVELPAGATATDLLIRLEINPSEVGILIINGKSGTLKDRLEKRDRVTLIPIIGGG